MKNSHWLLANLLTVAGCMAVIPALAADKVYLRSNPEGTVELSNSAGDGTEEEVVVANEPLPSAANQAANAARQPARPAPYQPNTARADTSVNTGDKNGTDVADNSASKNDKTEAAPTGLVFSTSFGGFSGNGGQATGASTQVTSGGSVVGGNTAPPTGPTSGGTGTPAVATNNSNTATPAVATTNTPTPVTTNPVASNPTPAATNPVVAAPLPPTDGTLSASLQRYRDLMLANANATHGPTNPAVVRRYLVVDKGGFQAR